MLLFQLFLGAVILRTAVNTPQGRHGDDTRNYYRRRKQRCWEFVVMNVGVAVWHVGRYTYYYR